METYHTFPRANLSFDEFVNNLHALPYMSDRSNQCDGNTRASSADYSSQFAFLFLPSCNSNNLKKKIALYTVSGKACGAAHIDNSRMKDVLMYA